jgi:hypothetical protein
MKNKITITALVLAIFVAYKFAWHYSLVNLGEESYAGWAVYIHKFSLWVGIVCTATLIIIPLHKIFDNIIP